MFDNNNKIFAYKIALKLDPYLVALFNLCYDINIKLENITDDQEGVKHAVSLFSDDFYNMLGINKDDYLNQDENSQYVCTKEEFFDTLAIQLNSHYLRSEAFLSKLKTKEFLYYFKDKFSIYSTLPKQREVENSLNDKLKKINVIGDIIDNLNEEKLRDSIKSISTIYALNKAGQYIKVINQENLKPELLYINADLLNFELLEFIDVDIEDIWINDEHELTGELKFDLDRDEYFIVIDKNSENKNVIGLKVNDHILLKYNVDLKKYIKEKNSNLYLWQLLKENYLRKREQHLYDSELIKIFKEKSNEREFNKLLCNLKHNLYIDRNVVITDDYQCFFEKFIAIKGLNDLSNFNFFLPDENVGKELLGIYTEQKIGKRYNLLNYLKHKDDDYIEDFVNSEPQKKKKIKVHILKAELSFYFVEKYYEDIIEGLLTELNIDFVSNVELCMKGQSKAEFDFVIFKDDKFYFLEAKTTLTKDNVYDTSKKYNNNIEYLKKITNSDVQNFNFILLGFLSNENIDNYRHFFTDENYNTPREEFAVTPYRFKVPFFSHQNLELECIAEPEISKLKEFIKEICQI